ncbi:hypothetical protein AB0A69_29750 [Streptomyces sp. NPDC045431]|uniref:hypothetical protein n=1 Tax=Streptomyces sp. NPDC045431 TaxID=3155613 RepID=UPI00340F5F5E
MRGRPRLRHPRRWTPEQAEHERRGVLRQAGAVPRFRHIELQHRLAAGADDASGAHSGVPGPRGRGGYAAWRARVCRTT